MPIGVAVLLVMPWTVQADEEMAGRPVRGITVEGTVSLTDDTLLHYLGLEPGQAFDPEVLNRNLHRLWESQLIDDIEVRAEPAGDGVRLRLLVEERPTLRAIVYEGLDKLNRSDIADRMAQERIQLIEGGPLQRGEAERLARAIAALYFERGFRLARVGYRLEESAPNGHRLVFTVDEGDKVRIEAIGFDGNGVFGGRRLRRAMKQTKETGLVARLRKRDVYDPATLAEDLQTVRDVYRNAGYKNVHIGEPVVDLVTPSSRWGRYGRGRRRLMLTIPIEESERWRAGSIDLHGNERYPDEALLSLYKELPGEWLRANRVDELVESIAQVYNDTGYVQAQVALELVELEDHVADIVVQIREGDQYRVGRLEFEGNTKTRDKALRREMRLQEAQIFSTAALRTSLRRVGQLQYWKVDESEPVALDVDPDSKTVDVTIQGQEGDRTELQFGAGWSETYGLQGQISVRTTNFLGRGETFGLSFAAGELTESYELSYAAPWFLDRPQSVGGRGFHQSLDYTTFDQTAFVTSTGGSLSYGRNLGAFGSAGASLTYYDEEGRISGLTSAGEEIELPYARTVASVRPAYTYDNRDNPLLPMDGWRLNVGVDLTGGWLGGTSNFIRPEASFSLWRPVSREPLQTVWGGHVRAGYLRPIETGGLFYSDRYFLGGEQAIRGFGFRTVTARDDKGRLVFDDDGLILGGEKMFLFNTEFHLVLGDPFRLLAFFDAGNVWTPERSYDLTDLRASAGVELRIFVPLLGAPLRFIRAQNLNPFFDDQFDSFQFSIGVTF